VGFRLVSPVPETGESRKTKRMRKDELAEK
jgi:hypothetical protein